MQLIVVAKPTIDEITKEVYFPTSSNHFCFTKILNYMIKWVSHNFLLIFFFAITLVYFFHQPVCTMTTSYKIQSLLLRYFCTSNSRNLRFKKQTILLTFHLSPCHYFHCIQLLKHAIFNTVVIKYNMGSTFLFVFVCAYYCVW